MCIIVCIVRVTDHLCYIYAKLITVPFTTQINVGIASVANEKVWQVHRKQMILTNATETALSIVQTCEQLDPVHISEFGANTTCALHTEMRAWNFLQQRQLQSRFI